MSHIAQQQEITVRPADPGDLDQVVALMQAADLAEYGQVETTREAVVDDWARPRFELDRDAVVAVHRDRATGRDVLVGYAEVYDEDGHGDFLGAMYLRPGHEDVVARLLARMEERCRGHGLHVVNPSVLGQVSALLARSGYEHVRSFYRMGMELGADADALPRPVWPAGIEARGFEPEHAGMVHELVDLAFAEHFRHVAEDHDAWRAEYLERAEARPDAWILAWHGPELCGVAMSSVFDDQAGWINKLAVHPAWRGRGLGRALLLATFTRFRDLGWSRAYLGVDIQNASHALGLYTSVGMAPIRQYDFWRTTVSP